MSLSYVLRRCLLELRVLSRKIGVKRQDTFTVHMQSVVYTIRRSIVAVGVRRGARHGQAGGALSSVEGSAHHC